MKPGEQTYKSVRGVKVTRDENELAQSLHGKLQSRFGLSKGGFDAPREVMARLRTGRIDLVTQGGSDVTEQAQLWIGTMPEGYNVIDPVRVRAPTSSAGHVLGSRFGGVGALGNITPMTPAANFRQAKTAEEPLAAALQVYNLIPGAAVCVSVYLVYIPGATPHPLIPAVIEMIGIVSLPSGTNFIIPALPVINR